MNKKSPQFMVGDVIVYGGAISQITSVDRDANYSYDMGMFRYGTIVIARVPFVGTFLTVGESSYFYSEDIAFLGKVTRIDLLTVCQARLVLDELAKHMAKGDDR